MVQECSAAIKLLKYYAVSLNILTGQVIFIAPSYLKQLLLDLKSHVVFTFLQVV